MENYIKEAKNGFCLDKTDSSGFRENQAYHVVNFLRALFLPAEQARMQAERIHLRPSEGGGPDPSELQVGCSYGSVFPMSTRNSFTGFLRKSKP